MFLLSLQNSFNREKEKEKKKNIQKGEGDSISTLLKKFLSQWACLYVMSQSVYSRLAENLPFSVIGNFRFCIPDNVYISVLL